MGLVFVLAGKMHKIEGSPVTMGGRVVGRSQSQPPQGVSIPVGEEIGKSVFVFIPFPFVLTWEPE